MVLLVDKNAQAPGSIGFVTAQYESRTAGNNRFADMVKVLGATVETFGDLLFFIVGKDDMLPFSFVSVQLLSTTNNASSCRLLRIVFPRESPKERFLPLSPV